MNTCFGGTISHHTCLLISTKSHVMRKGFWAIVYSLSYIYSLWSAFRRKRDFQTHKWEEGGRWKWKDISPRLGQSERPTGLPGKRQKRKELGNEDDTKIIREHFFPSILSLTPLQTPPPFLSLIFCSPSRESLWKGKIWDRLKQSQIQTVNLSWWSALFQRWCTAEQMLSKDVSQLFFPTFSSQSTEKQNGGCWGATSLMALV